MVEISTGPTVLQRNNAAAAISRYVEIAQKKHRAG